MGRNLSPVVRQELANLVKDPDSRKSAMKALTSYVKDIHPSAIPLFLAQVSESKDAGASPGEYAISLYEVLARVHGRKIVSQIDKIMTTIIKTLTTSGGSFPLQQACSKVVPAIARYGIEPTTPEDKKRHIIHSLCQPLSDSLLGTQECLSSGAALCLTGLVDCPNWRFASDEVVNEVCLKLAGALEDRPTQTSSHMGLVMSLAKHNGIIVEPYARLLIQSGLHILNSGDTERSSQKRLMAIHMIHFLMDYLDIRSISSELRSIIEEMEKCLSDQIRYVAGAASEALETAMRLAETSPRRDANVMSVTGSNFAWSNGSQRRCLSSSGDRAHVASPESQTLDSCGEFDSLIESPISSSQVSCNMDRDRRGVNRKPRRFEDGVVDISLKDGLFSEVVNPSAISSTTSEQSEACDGGGGHSNGFAGFVPGSPVEGVRSQSPSPQRTGSQINVDSIKIYTTPRKLLSSLQENDADSDYYENRTRRFRSVHSFNCDCSPVTKYNHTGLSYEVSQDNSNRNTSAGGEQFQTDSESVSSTEDILGGVDGKVSCQMLSRSKNEAPKGTTVFHPKIAAATILHAIFLGLFALCASMLWLRVEDEGYNLVPT